MNIRRRPESALSGDAQGMMERSAFRRAVEAKDLGALIDTFAEDGVLNSPVSFQPFRGRKAIGGLLYVLMDVFEDFHYTDEFEAPNGGMALVFRARVGDREVQGVDLLRFGPGGRVRELTVMIRPLSGLQALTEAVGPRLRTLGVDRRQ
jgi:hypothetical protein